jgi:hypothetical protein
MAIPGYSGIFDGKTFVGQNRLVSILFDLPSEEK